MIRQLLLGVSLAGLVVAITHGARAVETPRGGERDGRVRFVAYDPDQVVKVTGVIRSTVEIVFGTDETVDKVAIGDSAEWMTAPIRNILFLKPKLLNGPTNMAVVTTLKDGTARSYTFELIVREGEISTAARDAMFQVRFRYLLDEVAGERKAKAALERKAEKAEIDDNLDAGRSTGPINWAYAVQGSSALAPSEAHDNGKVTTLLFPENQPIPAIFSVLPDGEESLVEYTVEGHAVVIHAVSPEFRLRRGDVVATVYNHAFEPFGHDTGTGTTSDKVVREVATHSQDMQ